MDNFESLKNPKQEQFCQLLARGENQTNAYRQTYGSDNRANAARLAGKEHIRRRVHAIVSARRDTLDASTADAAKALKLSKQWVLNRLMRNAEECLENNSTRGAANRALELLGKELGLFIDRSEVKHSSGDLAEMTDAELLETLKREAAELEALTKEAESEDDGPGDTDDGPSHMQH